MSEAVPAAPTASLDFIREMVAADVAAGLRFLADKDVTDAALLGHSLGAWLAFELARELRRRCARCAGSGAAGQRASLRAALPHVTRLRQQHRALLRRTNTHPRGATSARAVIGTRMQR
jgi:pimeloyl-ACP methyl ester carboxylesterase